MNDVEFRQEIRQKFNKNENQIKDLQEQLIREKTKNEKTVQANKDLENQIRSLQSKHRQEVDKITGERDELNKTIVRIQCKET